MGGSRVARTVQLAQETVDYLDQLGGPYTPFADRSHVADWCIRQVQKRRILKPETELRLGYERPVKVAMTFAPDVFEYAVELSGPSGKPFKHAGVALAWCLEQARLKEFKPRARKVHTDVAKAAG